MKILFKSLFICLFSVMTLVNHAQQITKISDTNFANFDGMLVMGYSEEYENTNYALDSTMIYSVSSELYFNQSCDYLKDTLKLSPSYNENVFHETMSDSLYSLLDFDWVENLPRYIFYSLSQVYNENSEPLYPVNYCYEMGDGEECEYITAQPFENLSFGEVEVQMLTYSDIKQQIVSKDNLINDDNLVNYQGEEKYGTYETYSFNYKIRDIEKFNNFLFYCYDEQQDKWLDYKTNVSITINDFESIKNNIKLPHFFTIKEALQKYILRKGYLDCTIRAESIKKTDSFLFLHYDQTKMLKKQIKVKCIDAK